MVSHRPDSQSKRFHDRLEASFNTQKLSSYWPINQLEFYEKFTKDKASLASLITEISRIKNQNGMQAFFSNNDDLLMGFGEQNLQSTSNIASKMTAF